MSDSQKLIEKLKEAGILCVPTIGAGKHAQKAVDLGADIIVCQGGEGGGHTGDTPTWLLLAQTLDAVGADVPVAAAGGFRDGRGLAAALAFGADGIAMGTRFLLTSDSPTPEETKARYLQASVTEIPVSTALDGLPQRMVMNETLAALEAYSAGVNARLDQINAEALGREDVGPLAVRIVDQRDERGPVGIVFDTLNRAFNVELATFEVDDAVEPFGPAALTTHCDPSGVVPAAVFRKTLCEGLNGATFIQLRTVNQNQPTLARRRRLVRF